MYLKKKPSESKIILIFKKINKCINKNEILKKKKKAPIRITFVCK